MKKGTESLLKFRLLMADLDLPEFAVAGLLVKLWRVTEESAPQGDIGRYTDDEIAMALDWRGRVVDGVSPQRLMELLVARGWLDRHPEHRLVVHDWPEHCERRVHRVLARRGLRFADGSMPILTDFTAKEREAIQQKYEDCTVGPQHGPAGGTPGPSTVTVTSTVTGDETRRDDQRDSCLSKDSQDSPLEAQDSGSKAGETHQPLVENTAPRSQNRLDLEREGPGVAPESPGALGTRQNANTEAARFPPFPADEAQRIARTIGCSSEGDRSLIVKVLWLREEGLLTEHELADAVEATRRSGRKRKRPAYFHACLANAVARRKGSLNQLLASATLPVSWLALIRAPPTRMP